MQQTLAAPVLPTGPFTSADAHALGLSRRELDELVRTQVIRRTLRNVYVDASLPDTLDLRADAAALVTTPLTVFCDRTAAWLHGVDVLDYRELEILPLLECVVLRDRHRVRRRGCLGGERDLAPYDIVRVGNVLATSPLRTSLDLACGLRRPEGLSVLDQFLRLEKVTQAELTGALSKYRGRRGVVQARELVALADGRSESPGETRARLTIHDAGLPAPEPQLWVHHLGVPLFRLDLGYAKHRVAVEYDGSWHDETDEQRDADRKRREWLGRNGWTVIVVKRGDFGGESEGFWLENLRDALRLA